MRLIARFTLVVSVSALVGLSSMSACQSKDEDGTPAGQKTESTSQAKAGPRYHLRGVVEGFDAASNQLTLHHEAIPDFRNQEGEKVGMMSMTMEFRIAKGVDASQVKVGDKVAVEFEVQWDEAPPIEIVDLQPLPADTKLELGG